MYAVAFAAQHSGCQLQAYGFVVDDQYRFTGRVHKCNILSPPFLPQPLLMRSLPRNALAVAPRDAEPIFPALPAASPASLAWAGSRSFRIAGSAPGSLWICPRSWQQSLEYLHAFAVLLPPRRTRSCVASGSP